MDAALEQRWPGLDLEALQQMAGTLGAAARGGEIVLLRGNMGAGKTTFVRAFAQGLGLEAPHEVCSPTYTVCMTHAGPVPLVHLDLFRLGEMGDGEQVQGGAFESLGLAYDALPPPGSVMCVEWSELWADPPADRLELELVRRAGQSESRELLARATGPVHARLMDAWRASD